MDINKIIFSRTAPQKKLEIVNNLSTQEVLAITQDTIRKIIREIGRNLYRSKDKVLHFSSDCKVSNDWNAWIGNLMSKKSNLFITFEIQYENTDTSKTDVMEEFLRKGDYQGSIIRDDRFGNPRHYYFRFSELKKAEFIRKLFTTYLHKKYKERLASL